MEAENDRRMGEKMTDEERKKFVLKLHQARIASHSFSTLHDLCEEAANEIERLADERDQFVEQLAIRSETGMAKDMQEIMRINNELSEQLALAQSNAEPVAWRYKYKGESGSEPGDWFLADKQEIESLPVDSINIEPLYTDRSGP